MTKERKKSEKAATAHLTYQQRIILLNEDRHDTQQPHGDGEVGLVQGSGLLDTGRD